MENHALENPFLIINGELCSKTQYYAQWKRSISICAEKRQLLNKFKKCISLQRLIWTHVIFTHVSVDFEFKIIIYYFFIIFYYNLLNVILFKIRVFSTVFNRKKIKIGVALVPRQIENRQISKMFITDKADSSKSIKATDWGRYLGGRRGRSGWKVGTFHFSLWWTLTAGLLSVAST